jgi:hypothetical protein
MQVSKWFFIVIMCVAMAGNLGCDSLNLMADATGTYVGTWSSGEEVECALSFDLVTDPEAALEDANLSGTVSIDVSCLAGLLAQNESVPANFRADLETLLAGLLQDDIVLDLEGHLIPLLLGIELNTPTLTECTEGFCVNLVFLGAWQDTDADMHADSFSGSLVILFQISDLTPEQQQVLTAAGIEVEDLIIPAGFEFSVTEQ